MCLILFSYKEHPQYPLILIANRDEFHERPTHSLEFWDDYPNILAGRDQLSGGSWLGVSKTGRISGVTNFRSPASFKADAPSRGGLVSGFLNTDSVPKDYLESIHNSSSKYNGFNLLAGDVDNLYYYSNMGQEIQRLTPGVYGLSNAFLDTGWPKVETGKHRLSSAIKDAIDVDILFDILLDTELPPDPLLPDTGVGQSWERLLAPLFIQSPNYGTRSSAVILMETSGCIRFFERTYQPNSSVIARRESKSFMITRASS